MTTHVTVPPALPPAGSGVDAIARERGGRRDTAGRRERRTTRPPTDDGEDDDGGTPPPTPGRLDVLA